MTFKETNYPKHALDEAWNVGMRRVQRIMDEEQANGFNAWSTGLHSNLPDILVYDDSLTLVMGANTDSLVRVYECTNYRDKKLYIPKDRHQRYRDTLLQFKAEKYLVCSFEENLRYVPMGKLYYTQHGIHVVFVGYQD
jgi:hypothetical protein